MKLSAWLAPFMMMWACPGGPPSAPGASDASSASDSALFDELERPSGEALLRAYGYSLREIWIPEKIDTTWAPQVDALHLKNLSRHDHEQPSFTVMRIRGIDHLWVIPTSTGMFMVAHVENDPHNLAAFDAVLQSLVKQPSSAKDWVAAGALYMALLGQRGAIPILPEKEACGQDGYCSVAFSDRVVEPNERYVRWTLEFAAPSASGAARLVDVQREVIGADGEVVPLTED